MATMRHKKLLTAVLVAGVAAGAYVAFQLFGPPPPVPVSRETTYITEPLADDGLPNYVLAVINEQRRGVTPENNAAVLLWQSIGDTTGDAALFQKRCEAIGLEFDPDAPTVIQYGAQCEAVRAALPSTEADAKDALAAFPENDDEVQFARDYGDELWGRTLDAPWTTKKCPLLAGIVRQHSAALDLLVQGAERPRFYSPPDEYLGNPEAREMHISSVMGMDGTQAIRTALRNLNQRAMLSAGEGDHAAAWRDLRAIWQWGDLLCDGPTLSDYLVGIAVRGVAMHNIPVLLDDPHVPRDVVDEMIRWMADQPQERLPRRALTTGERYWFLELALELATRRSGDDVDLAAWGIELTEFDAVLPYLQLDPNAALRSGNEWYDRILAAWDQPDFRQRTVALERLDRELAEASRLDAGTLSRTLNRDERSRTVGAAMVKYCNSMPRLLSRAAARDAASSRLALTAAALAMYRIDHGEYPQELTALTPDILGELPLDPFAKGATFIYERRGDGYLLYSVFINGEDDGGTTFNGGIVDGEHVSEDKREKFDQSAADQVIRLPLPNVPWPEPPARSQEQLPDSRAEAD